MSYFLVIIIMGLVHYPHMSHYWQSNAIFDVPLVRQTMSRDLFWDIHAGLHFSPSTVQSILNDLFFYFWIPFLYIIVDESIISFKGRVSFRQRIFGKPHSTGKHICLLYNILRFEDIWFCRSAWVFMVLLGISW